MTGADRSTKGMTGQTLHFFSWILLAGSLLSARPAVGADSNTQGVLLGREGTVDFTRETNIWMAASVGQEFWFGDRVRTGPNSRATIRVGDLTLIRVNELTTYEVHPLSTGSAQPVLHLRNGSVYLYSRDRSQEFQIRTSAASTSIRGTEFNITVAADGRTELTLFDGEVDLSNPQGTVTLKSGEQGVAEAGQPPRKTALIEAKNLVQWWLYYPGILDPADLPVSPAEQQALAASMAVYRSGDLLQALAAYPAGRQPESDPERLYLAALLLGVGQVDRADILLNSVAGQPRTVRALRTLIAAVNLRKIEIEKLPGSATEWLARSYYEQAHSDLDAALQSARASVRQSPEFGFGWARVAELEFSFGHNREARDALDRAVKFSPRNAAALTLRGFIAASDNRFAEAMDWFNRAIVVDSALGNAWLGRGLCRIRNGDATGGRTDLQTAAALEPNRSLLRSYLGKAFSNAFDDPNARRELDLARRLDPSDPTPSLYLSLLNRQDNRINQSVRNLEESLDLNDNRRVYRSRLLLDQDRAVRSSSLASIYQTAGMNEVSAREAAGAVAGDYANHSAHLFLSDSFNALRDPTDFNLRYDTAWLNELLLANLLAPVGAGTLSRTVSQHEYSRLFDTDHMGLSLDSEARSDGQVRELASQYGTFGKTSYSLDLDYRHYNGVRSNNDLSRIEWFSQVKQQLTPRDSIFLFAEYRDFESGDNFQYYNPTNARPNFRYTESQKPNLLGAYHHEWAPGIHTLVLGGHLENNQQFSDTEVREPVLSRNSSGQVAGTASSVPMDVKDATRFEAFTVELNQIIQTERHTLVLGARYQSGSFHTTDHLALAADAPAFLVPFFHNPPAADDVRADFGRVAGYGYYMWKPIDTLLLTAGLAYDTITYPVNYRQPPVSSGSTDRDQISPKAALVWSPTRELTLRGIYARSLGGVTYDESYRLEPTQLAGFVQSFPTVISESVVGSVSAPSYDVAGLGLDLKLKTRTYLGVQAEFLKSDVQRQIGVFNFPSGGTPPPPPVTAGSTPQTLDYREQSVAATVNQLLSEEWSVGAQYRFTHARLHSVFPEIPVAFNPSANQTQQADLHQITLFALLNLPSGFFVRAESQWYHQVNSGSTSSLPTEDFWQGNLWIGHRFPRLRGEMSVGVLNLFDQDYHLNPLTLYSELPRERVFSARLRLVF